MMRVLAFVALLFLVAYIPLPIYAVLVVIYAYFFDKAYELVLLGIAADAFYGVSGTWPVFTLVCSASAIVLTWLKPQLLFYNEKKF